MKFNIKSIKNIIKFFKMYKLNSFFNKTLRHNRKDLYLFFFLICFKLCMIKNELNFEIPIDRYKFKF